MGEGRGTGGAHLEGGTGYPPCPVSGDGQPCLPPPPSESCPKQRFKRPVTALQPLKPRL